VLGFHIRGSPADVNSDVNRAPSLPKKGRGQQHVFAFTSMNLALFDFDGTITSNNTWTPFLKFAVRLFGHLPGRTTLPPIHHVAP
jgi:hypothetical protein